MLSSTLPYLNMELHSYRIKSSLQSVFLSFFCGKIPKIFTGTSVSIVCKSNFKILQYVLENLINANVYFTNK